MARSALQVQAEALQLTPPGWAFDTDVDGYYAGRLLPWASELARAEAQMEAMLPQVDMRVAFNLLADYQRVLGPDDCDTDTSQLSFEDQASLAYQRWTAGGDVCAGYFIRLAKSIGSVITIKEVVAWECSVASCDDEMIPAGENFVWEVNLSTDSLTNFECGPATCDDSLGTFEANLAQCPISHQAPLHTVPFFNYQGT